MSDPIDKFRKFVKENPLTAERVCADEALARLDLAERTIKSLGSALIRYARHGGQCNSDIADCSCGLDSALEIAQHWDD